MTQCVLHTPALALVPVFRFGSFRFFSSSSVICSENVISTIQQTKHHFCRFFPPLDWFLFDCIVAVVVRLYIKHFTPPSKSNRWRRQAANASPHKPHAHTSTQRRQTNTAQCFSSFFCCSLFGVVVIMSRTIKKGRGKGRRNGKGLFQIGSKHLDLLPKMYYMY